MDKAAVLTHTLKSKGVVTLLGGEPPASVLFSNKYIPPLTSAGDSFPSLDHAIRAGLSGDNIAVTLVGPEGSGKTTGLQQLVVDWAKGEHLQRFSHVFHFQFTDINPLEGALPLETLVQHNCIPLDYTPLALQKPEDVLFIFDGLDEYKHSLDPSAHTFVSDPSQAASASCLVASLLHGSLLRGAAVVVATRPTACLQFLSGTVVEALGFLRPQREAYVNSFFTEPAAAKQALTHMERTLGFYDFCSAPRFCWTVCSVYKSLIDSGEKLPETLSQLFVEILARLLQTLSLNEASNRDLVLALGRMASHFLNNEQQRSCTKEQMYSFGFQPFLKAFGVFLRVAGELDSDTCVFSFHSRMMQDFVLAVSFFLEKSAFGPMEEMLEGGAKPVDLFLSGLSEPVQRRPLEILLGEFSSEQIGCFKSWFKSSSEATLQGFYKDKHHRCFHLLHQAQSESLVKEIISPSARLGISYGDLSLQDCVALAYVVTCLGELECLNLYLTRNLTAEQAEALAPAMRLSHKINLNDSTLSTEAVPHLASALSRGVTADLDLSASRLGDEKLKILCSGLKDSKLHKLNLKLCSLTEAGCEDLVSVLTSDTSRLRVLDIAANKIGDQGFAKLCKALHSPHCKLHELLTENCDLAAPSMEALSAALCSGQSELRKVNLTHNMIGDSGVEALCKSLQHPLCKLQSVKFFDSDLTGSCCPHLREALTSEHCSLTELDLSVNELGQEGALLLCQSLSGARCPLEKLHLTRCSLTLPVFKELGSLLKSGTCRLKSLTVGINKVGDRGVKHLWDAVAHPNCSLEELDVEMTGLTDACVADLCAAVRASKTLKSLELRNNSLTDASVPALIQIMHDSANMQEMNLRYNEFSEDVFDMLDECDKIKY
ncbi:NACHT, LRR and PYD domains-containing protein 12 [Mugil cephalus]|uniref:NACHT, LRR and PYD domains-containing protein 12 n=1 Tax=Mugil cephalus TaxID=48193 RepID=UPI001FB76634|nr:NACHT, LRR and PYD domains-containing protein 12 [Mugil cephalus]